LALQIKILTSDDECVHSIESAFHFFALSAPSSCIFDQWVSKGTAPSDHDEKFHSLSDRFFSIYGQIGPGKRIAFSKLAVEYFEKFKRPFKLAIDVSIWHFQIQSGKGGSNPALRTLYYRLLRLLILGVQPLFVFDGANKPPFKRNAKTGSQAASLPNYLTKQLLKLFGFPFHTAPGEAEAECALLQKQGIVDAVLSEDVDTLMFGCSMTLRNWTSEGTRGSKSPTHVNVYFAEDARTGEARLDSEGMILIALMSGGDYIPAGVPRCGIKVACEAARAGFGRDLCQLSKDDNVGFRQWRERLSYELETNESGLFRVKHKALKIPGEFPDMAVLGYYTNPVVSSADKLRRLASDISSSGEIDVVGLREFVGEAFEWHHISGAKKFLRGIAPALLVRRLCTLGDLSEGSSDEERKGETGGNEIVTGICGRRIHFDTDGQPELRVMYTPNAIVGLDLEREEKESSTENCSESDGDQPEQTESANDVPGGPKTRMTMAYDPTQPERMWILETYAKLGVPAMVEAWEGKMGNPKKSGPRNARSKNPAKNQVRIDTYMKISKTASTQPQNSRMPPTQINSAGHASGTQAPPLQPESRIQTKDAVVEKPRPDRNSKNAVLATPKSRKSGLPSPAASADKNPWTLSKRPSDTFSVKLPRGSRYSALGIYETPRVKEKDHGNDRASSLKIPLTPSSQAQKKAAKPFSSHEQAIILSSSPESCSSKDATEFPTSPTNRLGMRKGTPCLEISHASFSGSLISPSALPSPSAPKNRSLNDVSLEKPSKLLSAAKVKPKKKSLITLRESLDGAWRTAESWETEGNYQSCIYENVEVVDLTQN
jgi:Holliday junction resolvase YEN1